MRKQVTSIEQSKWLLELGVPDDRACMVWVPNWTFDERMRQFKHTGDYNVCFRYAAYRVMDEELIPAFTVADLLQMLPKILHDNRGNELPINVTASTGSNWCLFYGNRYGHAWWKDSDSLVDLLIEAIEWLVTNGYPLNV